MGFIRLTFAAACAVGFAAAASPPPPHDESVEAGLQQVLDGAVASPGVFLPGAIAHYRNPAYAPATLSAGLADLAAQKPLRPRDRIRAGSIVKTFLATVTLQHVEEGTLSLEQTLTELLPEDVTGRFPYADQVTLRMLLNHTSGIPEWVTPEVHFEVAANPARIWTVEEALDIAAAQPPLFLPGTSLQYSNTNYTLVGLVLERAVGIGWREQIRSRVLKPLHLTSTSLPEPGNPAVQGYLARGYVYVDGAVLDLTATDPSMAGASGGNAMVTTVEDLARFLEALLAGELFANPATLTAMTTMIETPSDTGLRYWYGLGIESYELPGGTRVIGHAGGAVGYTVMMYQLPQDGTVLVTAVNANDLFTNALHVFIPSVGVITAAAAQ